ncbi:MAG: HNH endonuclease [Bacteroidaceae bacterium]|nr:HNH endonuclease [Bacteroidaceae bacterium]
MKSWTVEEVNVLIENYNKVSNQELAKLIPGKSEQGIYKKAYKLGLRKGAEIQFLNRSLANRGANAGNWKGGERVTPGGYRQILCTEHPRADKSGYVMEPIVVWEDHTGVFVPDNCCIHHLNGNKTDNRIENLCMMQRSAHTVFHHRGKHHSETTKSILSQKAKERFADQKNHPFYKDINVGEMIAMRKSGASVISVCKKHGISKSTYYKKLEEFKNGT